jgi:hypothetical protein
MRVVRRRPPVAHVTGRIESTADIVEAMCHCDEKTGISADILQTL